MHDEDGVMRIRAGCVQMVIGQLKPLMYLMADTGAICSCFISFACKKETKWGEVRWCRGCKYLSVEVTGKVKVSADSVLCAPSAALTCRLKLLPGVVRVCLQIASAPSSSRSTLPALSFNPLPKFHKHSNNGSYQR
jgi:hypothetical protein